MYIVISQDLTWQKETVIYVLIITNTKTLLIPLLLSFLSFTSAHVLLYPHCSSIPLHVFTKLASKVTCKQHMLSNKLCCSVKIKTNN